MPDLLKLLLVEDDELFRLGLATFFDREPTIDLVIEAPNGETAIELVGRQTFDVVVLDLVLPGLDGMETCRQIHKLQPNLPVLILTSHPDKNLVVKLVEVGIRGYCLKGIDANDLLLAIRSIATGATWWDATASIQIFDAIGQIVGEASLQENRTHRPVDQLQLTKRELEVLALIANGKTNQQIAEALFITPGTVRVHVHTILQKLNVSDRTQAAIFALQHQLI